MLCGGFSFVRMSLELRRDKRELPAWCALLCALITVLTVQDIPETAAASRRRNDPGAMKPRRYVADMLLVSPCQARHPRLCCILMKTDELALPSGLAGAPGSVRAYERSRTGNHAGREVRGF